MMRNRKPFVYLAMNLVLVPVLVLSLHYAAKELLLENGQPVHGRSMNHGLARMSGILDDGDFVLTGAIQSRSDVRAFATSRVDGYQVAGDYGDVIVFHPYGIRTLADGTRVTDPTIDTPPSALAEKPHSVVHRALVWVELNETTGNFDSPDTREFNITDIVIPQLGYYKVRNFDTREGTYEREDFRETLVIRSENVTYYPLGNHSGFITKGDYEIAVDQSSSPRTPAISPLVKPDWIIGKVTRTVDRETVEALDFVRWPILVVAEAAVVGAFLWRQRG